MDRNLLLLDAIAAGDVELLNYLLDCGAEVNSTFMDGRSPLHIAADIGHAEICAELIRRGAYVNALTRGGFTPLFFASRRSLQAVEILLQFGCDVEIRSRNGDTALHAASSFGREDVIAALIASGGDVNAKNTHGMTPLLLATISGSRNAVKTLTRSGADPSEVYSGPEKYTQPENFDLERASRSESCDNVHERFPRPEIVKNRGGNRDQYNRCDSGENPEQRAEWDTRGPERDGGQKWRTYRHEQQGDCHSHNQHIPFLQERHQQRRHQELLDSHDQEMPQEAERSRSKTNLNTVAVRQDDPKDGCPWLSCETEQGVYLSYLPAHQQGNGSLEDRAFETGGVGDNKKDNSFQQVAQQHENRHGAVSPQHSRHVRTRGSHQLETFSTCRAVTHHRKHRRVFDEHGNGDILSPVNKLLVGKLLRNVTTTTVRPRDKTQGRMEVKMVKGVTPLHRAAQLGMESVAEVLLEAGACVNAMTQSGETPLHFAALYSSISGRGEVTGLLRLLLKVGADIRAATSSGETPLHFAALVGDALTTAILISAGADVRAADMQGHVPLHKVCGRVVAPESNRVRTARLLLSAKADPNAKNFAGLSPLHALLLSQETPANLDLLREFLTRGADPNLRTQAGQHPLLLALDARRLGFARALVEKGADPSVALHDGTTPVHLACKLGDVQLFNLLLSKGGDPVKPDDAGFTPLRHAVGSGSLEMLRACVSNGVATWQQVVSSSSSFSDDFAMDTLLRRPYSGAATLLSALVSPVYYAFASSDLPAQKLLVASGAVSPKELFLLGGICELSRVSEYTRQQRDALAFVAEASHSPPSLQNLSRWKISHLIGCTPGRSVRARSLGLPAMLRDFVLLTDIV
ncbi:hypothetical protein BaRGS_00038932 [Batillaria attramentaria]|uniref:Ankyrin n=1 Tax=Batillaria attramentaria TaxID=370345 RepID=A0ABD0J5F4_9CAEN